jgi:hypothetical protein
LQSLVVNGSIWEISETYKQFSHFPINHSTSTNPHEIYLEKDGLTVSGNGVFGFKESQILNPQLKKADSNLNISDKNLKYLLAEYSPSTNEGSWQQTTVNFNIDNAYRENRSYSFILSIPGLGKEAGQNEFIEIDKIEIKLKGDNIFKTFSDKIKKL